MKDMLLDIRQKLNDGVYKNEEHVRLSLVGRVIRRLGWDLWNPREVNSEFAVLPQEDQSRVDLALFLTPHSPVVFIEVKPVGKLTGNIGRIERQLRDYNRNNTALFSIITDGRKWLFYYSQTGGEFSQKRFKTLDIIEDDVNDLGMFFSMFLSKDKISNGTAEREAKDYLQLGRKQRAMEDALPKAKRLVSEPPFPTLPQAVVDLAKDAGYSVSTEEARQFIKESASRDTVMAPPSTIRSIPTYDGIDEVPSPPTAPKIQRPLGRRGHEQLQDYVFPVIRMMRDGMKHTEAFKKIEKELDVKYNTVSAECTRSLGISTGKFLQYVSNGQIIDILKRRYPNRKAEIHRELE